MEFERLDQQFDQIVSRLEKKEPLSSGPYPLSILNADHHLLKKSWEYFKRRIATIESQWKEITQAKDKEIKVLIAQLRGVNEHTDQLEQENRTLRTYEEEFKKVRRSDFIQLERSSNNLKERWDDEREAFIKSAARLEETIEQQKAEFERAKDVYKERVLSLEQALQASRNNVASQLEQQNKVQAEWTRMMEEKGEEMTSLQSKIDLLRSEVEHRDQIIRTLKEQSVEENNHGNQLEKSYKESLAEGNEKSREIVHLKRQVELLEYEMTTLRTAWSNEQAEWRELWDRGREAWEKSKKNKERE